MPRLAALCAALFAAWLPACAHTPAAVWLDGKQVPLLDQEFAGQPYNLRHSRAHPRPGGASSGTRGPGGRISGTACGADLSFEVEHRGDHVQLTGFVDPGAAGQAPVDAHLRVEDRHGRREITGQMGTKSVDVVLLPNRLVGVAGAGGAVQDPFDLRQEGNDLVGQVRLRLNQGQAVHIKLTGRDALWSMPPADQAAVVPMLLLCLQYDRGFQRGIDPAPLGFGGAAGAVPRGTMTLRAY